MYDCRGSYGSPVLTWPIGLPDERPFNKQVKGINTYVAGKREPKTKEGSRDQSGTVGMKIPYTIHRIR